jgi:hypothetical protein
VLIGAVLLHTQGKSSYCSPDIIRMIQTRRMSWVGHVAYMSWAKIACKIWLGNLKGRGLSGNLCVDGRKHYNIRYSIRRIFPDSKGNLNATLYEYAHILNVV